MDQIYIIFFIVIALAIGLSFLGKIPSVQRRYREMDDRKLIDTMTSARLMRWSLLGAAILGPLAFAFLSRKTSDPEVKRLFMWLTIVLFLVCLSASWFFKEIRRISESEIEYRKFKKEKEEPT